MMKSTGVLLLWLALVVLGALGLADALHSATTLQPIYLWLIPYAAAMVALPGYSLLRRRRVQWPVLYMTVAVVCGFAGCLLLARAPTVAEGSAFLAMGISIFVVGLVRGFRSA
jgi:hypothetical protein